MDGELPEGDESKFANIAIQASGAIVLFDSPGGNLVARMAAEKAAEDLRDRVISETQNAKPRDI
jgi:hypothetical protein